MKHHFLDEESKIQSPIRNLNPKTKFITIISMVVLIVSTPADNYISFLLYGILSSVLIIISRVPLTVFLKRLPAVIPFILVSVFAIPFAHQGQPGGSISLGIGQATVSYTGLLLVFNVAAKSILSIILLTLLTSSTPYYDLLTGLRELRMPGFLIDTLSFMYHYLFIIVDEFERVSLARDARLYGNRWIWHAPVIGYMVGSIFVRSYERGERIFQAMRARGYDSNLTVTQTQPLRYNDYVFAFVVICVAAIIRTAGGFI